MARFTRVPQDPDIDANSAGLARITPIAGVAHDTIGVYSGPDSGDSQYIEDHRLCQFVVGEDWGEWEQLFDSEAFCPHCNGANRLAIGVEFSRTYAGQPLTGWQKLAWQVIREEAEKYHGIPNSYLDPQAVPPASVWVNGGSFRGWISHLSVKTDDGSAQHTDYVQYADFTGAIDWSFLNNLPTRRSKRMFVAQDPRGLWLIGDTSIQALDQVSATNVAKGLGQPVQANGQVAITVTKTFIDDHIALAQKYGG